MTLSVKKALVMGLLALAVGLTAGLAQAQQQKAIVLDKVIIIPYYEGSIVHLRQLKGQDFDKALYVLLIAHEKTALEMAKTVIERSQNANVELLAKEILKRAPGYISTMENQLRVWKGHDPSLTIATEVAMASRIYAVKHGLQPDHQFVSIMVNHFQETIDMAELASSHSENPEVKKFASELIGVLRGEMTTYRNWLISD